MRFVSCKDFQPTPLYICIKCVKIRCTRKGATFIKTWNLQPSTNNMWPVLLLAVVSLGNGFKSISKHFVVNHSTARHRSSTIHLPMERILHHCKSTQARFIPGAGVERCCRKSSRIQRRHHWIYSPLLAQSRVKQPKSPKETALLYSVCDTHEDDKCGAIC